MNGNIIQLFGGNDDLFGKLALEIAEHFKGGKDLEDICLTYIGIGAYLWAETVGYPHVQKELAYIAVELERMFVD